MIVSLFSFFYRVYEVFFQHIIVYYSCSGSVHEADLGFMFGAPLAGVGSSGMFNINYTRADASISLAVMNYWANFAKSG